MLSKDATLGSCMCMRACCKLMTEAHAPPVPKPQLLALAMIK